MFYSVNDDEQEMCGNWCDSNVNTSIIIVVAFVTTGLVMYCCRNRWILVLTLTTIILLYIVVHYCIKTII